MAFAISVEKLVAWNGNTARRFHDFVQLHPVVFHLPSDIRNSETVAGTLQHVVYLELRFANLIAGLPKRPLEDIPYDSIGAIHQTHRQAMAIIHELLVDPTFDWSREIAFEIPGLGPQVASCETFLVHLTMHSIRHYAQLATLVRQAGFEVNWRMDYLFTQAH